MIRALLFLLILPQQLTWYETYERGEKHFLKGNYQACIDDMQAALAVKPEPKLNQFTRAVQKIDYKPFYYLALCHDALGQTRQAYEFAQKAYAAEVVQSAPILQSRLAKILDSWRQEVTLLHQQYAKEQAVINTRTRLMSKLAEGRLDEVADELSSQTDPQPYGDIQLQLDMRRELQTRTETFVQDIIQQLESLVGEGRPALAKEIFQQMKQRLPEAEQERLGRIIEEAQPEVVPTEQPEPIEETSAPVVDSLGPSDQEELETFKNRMTQLESQTVEMRAALDSMSATNRDLQQKLADRRGNVERSQPILAVQPVGGRYVRLEAQAFSPLKLTAWQILVNGTMIATPAVSTPEGNHYTLNHRFALPDYGNHEITFLIGDELSGEASITRTIALERPWYLHQTLWWGLLGILLGLVVLWWIGRIRRKRRARLRHFNPYIAGSPVREDDMFYGRDALLHRIQGLVHKNSFMIHGARRIGKTSLLLQLKAYLAELNSEEYRFFPAFIDLQGVKEEDLFTHMMDEIMSHAEEWDLPERDWNLTYGPGKYHARQFSKDLKQLIAVLSEMHPDRHVQVVLLMDEVDVLNEFGEKTNQKLRGIFMKDYAEHLSCVMAGIHLKKEWDSSGSPWYNFFEQIPVGQFADVDAKALILKPVRGIFTYDKDAVDLIVSHTECHPYLIQKVCVSLIGDKLKDGKFRINRKDAEAALARLDEEIQRNRNELHHQQMG